MEKPHIILASASIGRKDLLNKLGIQFSVLVSDINEESITHSDIYEMLRLRARAKAENVSNKLLSTTYNLPPTSYLIVAADSMAILDGKTYGKAKDHAHTKKIVKALMGHTHEFVTATTIILSSPTRRGSSEIQRWEDTTHSFVTLRAMSEKEIDEYTTRYDFTKFAAAYTLNETPWDNITKIEGSYTNVIGLPFEVLLPILRQIDLL